jgi:16S rRNA (guanine527-N7)-methyltransferase
MNDPLTDILGQDVPRETLDRLDHYSALLRAENEHQNLVSSTTLETMWQRHIRDSAQLVPLGSAGGPWVDIGSGAGLPGMVIALLTSAPVTLVEPRRLRADFLQRCVDTLGLADRVTVIAAAAAAVSGRFDTITARAVAALPKLFGLAHHLSHPGTVWVLPKGRSGEKELAQARQEWQGRFVTRPSLTDGDAVIVLATDVARRGSA